MKDIWIGIPWAMWTLLARMAPYLLLGFLLAGALHVALPAAWVRRHLGGGRRWAPLKAALLGVPLPLCSCSVLPVTATLARQGASRGALAAFLMSTPQTGVDSLLVTYGLLGPLFAVVRPVVAFVSGALTGWAVDAFAPGPPPPAAQENGNGAETGPVWRRALRYGFRNLPRDIGPALLLGVAISGLLTALLPENYFADRVGPGWPGMLLMLAVGIPLYVCSTASVPIALALMHAGLSAGAALVFLITGPATNGATLTTLAKLLGARATALFFAGLVASALAFGWAFDRWLLPAFGNAHPHLHPTGAPGWQHLAAVALLAILAAARLPARKQPACLCHK